MEVLMVILMFILIYIAIFTSLILICLIEVNDTTRFIKKQFRELLTKELLQHLQEASKLEKQLEQIDQPHNN